MIYIHAIGIHNTFPHKEQIDLESELRAISGKVWRRSDHFIQLALIGVLKATKGLQLAANTAIYLTSGQGDISVFRRVYDQCHTKNELTRPIDFINLLSNSAGFYVGSHLGLNGKNIFVYHHRFPVQMTMLAACNDVNLGKQEAILVGGVDEWTADQNLAKKLLGVEAATSLGEGSNWMLINDEPIDALGTFEMEVKGMDESSLRQLLLTIESGTYLAFSKRFSADKIAKILGLHNGCKRYCYDDCGYYETLPLYALNSFLSTKRGRMIHLDVSDGSYMVMIVDNINMGG